MTNFVMIQCGRMRRLIHRGLRPPRKQTPQGMTLTELMIVTAILATLAALAVPLSRAYFNKVRVARAIEEIRTISLALDTLKTEKPLPDSLDAVGYGQQRDPWGRPYGYFNLTTRKGNGAARKDRNLVPLNGDYDLYSLGADGQSASALTAKASHDDIVRADNGGFIGLASHY